MLRIAAGLLAFFALEVLVLTWVGPRAGVWATLGWMLATSVAGVALARSQGLAVLHRWLEKMADREQPEEGLVDGLLVLAGGALLVLPGLVGDALGALLFVPPLRRALAERVRRRAQGWVSHGDVEVLTWEARDAPVDDDADAPAREVIDAVGVAVDEDVPAAPLLPPGPRDR